MDYPPLVYYNTAAEYRDHFENVYCRGGPIKSFDGIEVRFRRSNFNHCFFESSRKKSGEKDRFSFERAKRIDWIKTALQDPDAELKFGFCNKTKQFDQNRRVALVQGNFVVVIRLVSNNRAQFITAFAAETTPRPRSNLSTVDKIRMDKPWQ